MKALCDYGFVPPLSSADSFPVTIPRSLYTKHLLREMIPTDSSSSQACLGPLALLRDIGIQYANQFDVTAQGAPKELLEAVRILVATPNELIKARKSSIACHSIDMISEENELRVRDVIAETLNTLSATPEDKSAQSSPFEARFGCAQEILASLHQRRTIVLQSALYNLMS